MCVDDYQFRHFSAVKTKQCRRFVFINQDEIEKTFLVNISQFQQDGEVALCKILRHLSNKGLQVQNRKFYMPKYNVSIQCGDYCKVPFSALSDKQILFHQVMINNGYEAGNINPSFNPVIDIQEQILPNREAVRPNDQQFGQCISCMLDNNHNNQQINRNSEHTGSTSQELDNLSLEKNEEQHPKRMKQPQRQIGEVILAVKKWRKLYESKKLNLTKSAKLIGISKKSLDDYYLVLRVGEILGFDYDSNLTNKMGDLRAYIRSFDYKVTGKLTKQVKCFQLVPQIQVENIMEQQVHEQVQNQNDSDQV